MTSARAFHHFARLTVVVGIALIWWGAAVTTEDVGLSVPDWPLCYGHINPEGWWGIPALLLEHGHRWIGASIGVLVLILYVWQLNVKRTVEFIEPETRFLEGVGVVLCGIGYFYLVRHDALGLAFTIAGIGFAWLVITWIYRRWPLLRGLATLALLMVILQASLGGLRVLQMSDPYGIIHGVLGQLFFCVLLWIAFASSHTWRHEELILHVRQRLSARLWSLLLFLAVFGQLVIGAILRHTQRDHLAASDLFTTGGVLIPGSEHADLFTLFLHKYCGISVAILTLLVACRARLWLASVPTLARLAKLMIYLPLIQVGLGISVILTGKSFWVTNFHVINGLLLLASSFLIMVSIWSSCSSLGLVAEAHAHENDPESPAEASTAV
ncbi:MAG: COX15/CtaA family protein [Verrucomicrobiales bacterium]|nr:COX15/CtaA family protein [Verrucomicrobiales bacterium]MCP5557870.1 COX15/CtaA family protein [Verrucomicrobiaceae bacterium]